MQESERRRRETPEHKDQREKEAEKKALALKTACQRIFTSPDGILVAKAMMKTCHLYDIDKGKIEDQRGMEKMYLMFVKGVLKPEQCMLIESPENGGK